MTQVYILFTVLYQATQNLDRWTADGRKMAYHLNHHCCQIWSIHGAGKNTI